MKEKLVLSVCFFRFQSFFIRIFFSVFVSCFVSKGFSTRALGVARELSHNQMDFEVFHPRVDNCDLTSQRTPPMNEIRFSFNSQFELFL